VCHGGEEMEEYKTAVVLNYIAGKDSSTQKREDELAQRKFISSYLERTKI
jgi:hypothetical protein